ncbi:MAG: hypothetical protein ACRD22_06915 [Terriglobia bacterium]
MTNLRWSKTGNPAICLRCGDVVIFSIAYSSITQSRLRASVFGKPLRRQFVTVRGAKAFALKTAETWMKRDLQALGRLKEETNAD